MPTIAPEFILENEVYVAVSGCEPVGFHALVGEGRGLNPERLWVLPDHIGTGLGRTLFEHAMRRAAILWARRSSRSSQTPTRRVSTENWGRGG